MIALWLSRLGSQLNTSVRAQLLNGSKVVSLVMLFLPEEMPHARPGNIPWGNYCKLGIVSCLRPINCLASCQNGIPSGGVATKPKNVAGPQKPQTKRSQQLSF